MGESRQDDDFRLINAGGAIDHDALYRLYSGQDDNDDKPIDVTFELTRDLNKRLDRYLVDRIPFLSRTSLQRLIREEAVTVNERPPKPSTRLRRGDRVHVVLPPPPSTEIPAEDIPLHILYEDDDIIVINKADDIIVHPARGNRSGTIINALAYHFQHRSGGALSSVGEEFARPGVVHRLDRHTTGVMVAAKTDTAHWRLGRQFEKRTTDKRYLAVVHGRMETHADVIDLPLGKHPVQREKYAVRWDDTGKPSVTIYRVREVYRNHTLVELELKSGRTHQIRVHLSHIGYPIVGDDMYGGTHLLVGDITGPQGFEQRGPREPLISRQALHAARLGVVHPITEKPVVFEAPLHADMRDLVTLLRAVSFEDAPKVAGATIDLETMIAPASTPESTLESDDKHQL
jgi:23S rRNA pseudouridine1911/1915/1917 synthase